jgi:hypothetical protein
MLRGITTRVLTKHMSVVLPRTIGVALQLLHVLWFLNTNHVLLYLWTTRQGPGATVCLGSIEPGPGG